MKVHIYLERKGDCWYAWALEDETERCVAHVVEGNSPQEVLALIAKTIEKGIS